jgi:preprotein translocase subunit SecD
MMLRYWRILLLIVMVAGACLAIGMKPHYDGVQIAYVTDASPAAGVLKQGMIIHEVNGEKITNEDQWNGKMHGFRGNLTLKVYDWTSRLPNDYAFFVNDSVGIDVISIDNMNIEFGLDIKGGTRIVLMPKGNVTKDTVSQIISTLETRANIYGLKEIRFMELTSVSGESYIQVEATGVGRDVVENLLSKQGNFEAKISKPVFLSGGKGTFELGENKYPITLLENSTVILSNLSLNINQTFTLDGIDFEYVNSTSSGEEVIFLGTAYKGDDIEMVYSDPQHSGIMPRGKVYSFYFTTLVSEKGADRFARITTGIPSQLDLNSGDYYLKDCWIVLYLDKNPMSNLRISSALGGKVYTTPSIEGSRETKEAAFEEKNSMQTILRSGALPVGLETASVGIVSPTLGQGFMYSAIIAGCLAAVAVAIVVFVRYRKLKIAIPMVLTGLSEIIIILGLASTGDAAIWMGVMVLNIIIILLAWWKKQEMEAIAFVGAILIPLIGLMSWTIDLPAIGGIIAAIGTGMDNMIIIADETLSGAKERKIIYTIKDKIKHAFFIIFGSASVTIAAMVPLMFLGVGLVRGFAITTMIGILVGVLVARPAYAKVIEISMERSEEKERKKK